MIIFSSNRIRGVNLGRRAWLWGLCLGINLAADADESSAKVELERVKEVIALAEGDCEDCLSAGSCTHCGDICTDDTPPPNNNGCKGPETQEELAAKIMAANSNDRDDVINLCGKTIQLTNILDLTDGNTGLPAIEGDNAHTLTIKNGTIERSAGFDSLFRIFLVTSSGSLIIEDLKVANGLLAGQQGGCIKNHGLLSVIDSRLENCEAQSINFTQNAAGGAIYNDGEIPQIIRSFVADSDGGLGSGIYNANIIGAIACSNIVDNGADGGGAGGGIYNAGTIGLMTYNIIERNLALSQVAAGGINNDGLILAIENSYFFRNRGSLGGGGIRNAGGQINTIINTTFALNRGDAGGGIWNAEGQIDAIINTTFAENIASSGGAILLQGPLLLLANSTISDNLTNFGQGAVGISVQGSLETMVSTIIANNRCSDTMNCSPDVFGNVGSEANNLIGNNFGSNLSAGDPNGFFSIVGTPEAPIDPRLGSLGFYGGPTPTMPLLIDSPAIIHGANPQELLYDQRGPEFARETQGYTDIGAYQTAVPCSKCPDEEVTVSVEHHDHGGGGGHSRGRDFDFGPDFIGPPPVPVAPGPVLDPVPVQVKPAVDPLCVDASEAHIKSAALDRPADASSLDGAANTAMGCSLTKNGELSAIQGFWLFALLCFTWFRKRTA